MAASTLGDALPRPLAIPQPAHSVVAKALHAFWYCCWAFKPRDTSEGPSEGVVVAGSGRSAWVAGKARPDDRARRSAREDGADVAAVVHWNAATSALVVTFTGCIELVDAVLKKPPEVVPVPWLGQAAGQARVVRAFDEEMRDVFGDPAHPVPGTVAAAIDAVLRDPVTGASAMPAAITCTGYGTGGALATLAAARLALRYPLADTACISFGSPNVFNAAFAQAFSLVVGQSFRVEVTRDPLTALPTGGGWAFPASFDVPCDGPVARGTNELEWDRHTLESYFLALLGLANPNSLPYSPAGVYLMVSPVLFDRGNKKMAAAENADGDGHKKAWPIDKYFVPDPGSYEDGWLSPYEARVELGDGQVVKACDLFNHGSQLWRDAAAALQAELGSAPALQAAVSASPWQPGQGAHPPRSKGVSDRFMPPAAPEWSWFDLLAWLAKKPVQLLRRNKEEHDSRQDTTALPTLRCRPPGDLADHPRGADMLAAHRLPLALLLADAAYRDSPTGKPPPTATAAPPPPVVYPAPEGLQDPFHGAIQDLVAQGRVLAFRLVDDTQFARLVDGTWQAGATGNVTNTQAYVLLLEGGAAAFAFRGTSEQAADWATNFDMALRDIAGASPEEASLGDVHQGFMRGFCSVAYRGNGTALGGATAAELRLAGAGAADGGAAGAAPAEGALFARHLSGVLQELMAAHPATRPLVEQGLGPTRVLCVGHSLGGALATLCAAWAAEQYPLTPVSCFTFGQPRTGNKAFVDRLAAVTNFCTRTVHRLDVVPLVPLHAQGFEHWYPAGYVATSFLERFLVRAAPSRFLLQRRADRRWLTLPQTAAKALPDHLLTGYIPALQKALDDLEGVPPAEGAE